MPPPQIPTGPAGCALPHKSPSSGFFHQGGQEGQWETLFAHKSPSKPPLRKPAGRPKLQAPKCPLAFFHDVKINGCTQSIYQRWDKWKSGPSHATQSQSKRLITNVVLRVLSRSSCPTATPWAVACQAPLSMEFSRQEY